MTIRTGAFVAVAASVICFLVVPLVWTENIAFADVKARVERIRTVEYVETSFGGVEADPDARLDETVLPGQLTVAETIVLLEESLKTAKPDLVDDIKLHRSVFRGFQRRGPEVLSVRRVRIKGRHLERMDQLLPYAATPDYTPPPYSIRNARNGLSVSFIPAEKKKAILKQQVAINPETGEESTSDIPKISPTVDFFARFRNIPAEAAERLPKKTLGGREVIGFRSVEKRGDMTWTHTHWVGTDSKLPVEMVTELRKAETVVQRWVHNRFIFDQEMSDELFCTETPEGYQSEDEKVFGFAL